MDLWVGATDQTRGVLAPIWASVQPLGARLSPSMAEGPEAPAPSGGDEGAADQTATPEGPRVAAGFCFTF